MTPPPRTLLFKWATKFDADASGRLLVLSVVVGAIAGILAVAFYCSVGAVTTGITTLYQSLAVTLPQAGREESFADVSRLVSNTIFESLLVPKYWPVIILVPTLGGLACGLLVSSFAPEAFGEGTDAFVKSFHRRGALVRLRILVTKWITSIVTLGTGGSGGLDGAVVLVGGGVGTRVARWCGTTVQERRLLFLAGAASGLAAIFQVPIAGALFAVEVLYCSTALEFRALLPCLVASTSGFAISRLFLGEIFRVAPPTLPENFNAWLTLLPAMFLCGVVCAAIGFVYVTMLHAVRNRVFRRLILPDFLKPALGGLVTGCVAVAFPQVLGTGETWTLAAATGQLSVALMLWLVIPKIVATVATVASGGSGGLLAPSLFIGAMLGGAFGGVWNELCDGFRATNFAPSITLMALVGMGAFYAGVGKVPLTAAVLVCEMSGCYQLLPVVLGVSLVHLAFQSPRVSLYEDQVLSPLDSPAHFGSYVTDILEAMTVRDIIVVDTAAAPLVTISEHDTIPEAMRRSLGCGDALLPVVDSRGDLLGLISQSDIRASFASLGTHDLLAGDLVQIPRSRLVPADTLYTAMRLMLRKNVTEVPVVDPRQPQRLLGMIRQRDIIAAHNRAIAGYRDASASGASQTGEK
ncbi:MAG: chloride channel protein [Thermoguttaceae bacterium]